MGKVSIEQQIEALTPEQKNNIGKIYKKYITLILVVFITGVLIAIGLFAEASISEGKANDRYKEIQTQIKLNEMSNKYDLSLYEESHEAFDDLYDAKDRKSMSLVIGSGVAFFGVLIIILVFKIKYPYFSEKKYGYLKKLEKNNNNT